MKSPFPGMDPWLELFWPDVHTRLLVSLSNALYVQLPDGLVARVEESLRVDAPVVTEGWEPRDFRADVAVLQQWPEPSVVGEAGDLAVAEPILFVHDEPEIYRHLELRDMRAGGEVVTVVEVLSPVNRRLVGGDNAYLRKRADYLAAGVNVVEINLLRAGADMLLMPANRLPVGRQGPYRVCVRRASKPWQDEVYPLPIRQRLSRVPVPLRRDDRDAIVDLQELVNEAYTKGGYRTIDYTEPLEPPFAGTEAEWVRECLRASGRVAG